ncbi:hypothetical protein HDE79_004379 [Rhodanobacter sp. MP1X3]|nr:hypothetical protein [Rhodanobacter sp. MP1X3]
MAVSADTRVQGAGDGEALPGLTFLLWHVDCRTLCGTAKWAVRNTPHDSQHFGNLVITAAGFVIGAASAIGINLWRAIPLEVDRLTSVYFAIGAVALLLLQRRNTGSGPACVAPITFRSDTLNITEVH